MTTLQNPTSETTPTTARRTKRWISDWRPEDPEFWESTGRPVARRNLVWSILAEHIGFSVWFLWSMSTGFLAAAGFGYDAEQLFILTSVSSAVGAFLRVPYTFAVPIFGGRNWTVLSALLLLIPTIMFVVAVQNPETSYTTFVLIAALSGFGGGNFASSMANINAFYPAKEKGLALGLNAAGGNIGVAVVQLILPIVIGAGGLWGLIKGAETIQLANVGYLYIGLSLVAAAGAYFFMNNLEGAQTRLSETATILKQKQTWIMSFLYVGTFGSFIGYSGAFGLLIKLYFSGTFDGAFSGYTFAYYAFLGATVGSICRPIGGRIADKLGGAKVTLGVFLLQAGGTLGILYSVYQLEAATSPEAVAANGQVFNLFLATFLFVFAMTGFGNGSTFKMIPAIWKTQAELDTPEGGVSRTLALKKRALEASAAVGIVSAVGAFGGFVIPMMFAAPWVPADGKLEAVQTAFWVFTAYYVACAVVTYAVYMRKGTPLAEANV
ncbi:MFS transporter [Nocardioides bruguierae]|uniref:NarK/NasA family nitrate transporter n=1 Tax=Nocardioides bruguierae TaxID=2945102 RepID=A0A9X2IFQ7_9ACTN|nr:nitrate/nitrite transporter [Nocardioides bruguierae]MCM0620724.1 NarK/NasA family nitrate transporter [Nocardioides bruguierae]